MCDEHETLARGRAARVLDVRLQLSLEQIRLAWRVNPVDRHHSVDALGLGLGQDRGYTSEPSAPGAERDVPDMRLATAALTERTLDLQHDRVKQIGSCEECAVTLTRVEGHRIQDEFLLAVHELPQRRIVAVKMQYEVEMSCSVERALARRDEPTFGERRPVVKVAG